MDNLILQINKAKQHLSLIYFRNLSFTELPAWQCDLVLFRDWPATFLSDVIIGPLPLAIRVVQKAKVALGQDKQKTYIILNGNFLCLSSPSATFALQRFCTT